MTHLYTFTLGILLIIMFSRLYFKKITRHDFIQYMLTFHIVCLYVWVVNYFTGTV